MNDPQSNNNEKYQSDFSYIKLFFIINIFVFLLAINPWIYGLRLGAIISLGIEFIVILLTSIPVFFYQLLINKKNLKESLKMAITSFLNIISYFNGAIF